jgi:hypothetical protein
MRYHAFRMGPCQTEECRAIQKLVENWLRENAPNVRASVLESQDNVDVVIRLWLSLATDKWISLHDIALPLSNDVREEITTWLVQKVRT